MSGCRLVNNITPVGVDVKGGEAVHFTLCGREMEKDAAGCRAFHRNFIVGDLHKLLDSLAGTLIL